MRKIHFKITKRLKSNNSLVSKEIRDPKYYTSDRNSDLYGATFEVEKNTISVKGINKDITPKD